MNKNKKCSRCRIVKDIDLFGIDRKSKDGHNSRCFQCRREIAKIKNKTEKTKKRKTKYRNTDKGKASQRRYTVSKKGRRAQRNADLNQLNDPKKRIKIMARRAVRSAVSRGELEPVNETLCVRCGALAKQYHHQSGYEKENWLDVVPVCVKCHNILDRENSE